MSYPQGGVKVWGTTTPLLITPLFEMHRLIIKPNHRCSMHVHSFKHNAFYVLSGQLFIDSEWGLSRHGQTAILAAGDTYTIRPGIDHQFRTRDAGCTTLEMYYTEPLSEDITRRNMGGPT